MKRICIALALAGSLGTSWAQVQDIRLGEDDANEYFIVKDSFVVEKDRLGVVIAAASMKSVEKATRVDAITHHLVSKMTCDNEKGSLITIDNQGQVVEVHDVTLAGEDRMSVMAYALCGMYRIRPKK